MAKNLDKKKCLLKSVNLYARYRENQFRAAEGALEAPNHALAPPNEVLQDSEWFQSISHGKKPRKQKKSLLKLVNK